VAAAPFDVAVVTRGVVGQLHLLDDCIARLEPDEFERPTRLTGWRVAELVAHVGMSNLSRYLAGPSAPRPAIDG
jgi:hypothetical protein